MIKGASNAPDGFCRTQKSTVSIPLLQLRGKELQQPSAQET
nr:MAG TPA: hypothetical protein [Caudoviricetes sp.]